MIEQALVDEEAIINAAKTNSDAFGKLYEQYQQRVFSYVLYRVADTQSADDLTAQIFERALRKITTYQPNRGVFAVWLFAIARNTVNNHLRAKRLRQWVTLDLLSNRSTETMSVEELVCQDEQIQQLLALITQLSSQERDLLALKFGAGLTNRRIAELSGLTESNVGVMVYRTIRKLRDQFSNGESKHEQAASRGRTTNR